MTAEAALAKIMKAAIRHRQRVDDARAGLDRLSNIVLEPRQKSRHPLERYRQVNQTNKLVSTHFFELHIRTFRGKRTVCALEFVVVKGAKSVEGALSHALSSQRKSTTWLLRKV
jgi:hypothetical protein